MNRCRRFPDEALLEVGDGEPPRPGFEAHLSECATCRERADAFRRRALALRGLARLDAPADLWDRIEFRRARTAVPLPIRPAVPMWLRAACFLGIAASVAISAGLAVVPDRRHGPPPGVIVVDAGPSPEVLSYIAEGDGEFFAEDPGAWREDR